MGRKAFFLLAGLLAVAGLAVLAVSPVAGQGEDVTVTGAKEVIRSALATGLPPDLASRLAGVGPWVIVSGSDHLWSAEIGALPTPLQTILGQVAPKVVVHGADNTWQAGLAYPVALFNDTTPPQISRVAVSPSGLTSAIVTWDTDEFATSAVLYGTQSGIYPWVVRDPLYTRAHQVTLRGLTPGTRYYFRIQSTDRSGNTATSAEYSFVMGPTRVYLPLVLRGR